MNKNNMLPLYVISIAALCFSIISIFMIIQGPKKESQEGSSQVKEAQSQQVAEAQAEQETEAQSQQVTEDQSAQETEAETEGNLKDIQYVLYLGTNDKDTNKPVFKPKEAREKLKSILISRFGGYTITDANGGWVGDNGKEYQEYTLIIYLSDTDMEKVHALCDELIEVYRQSSVLIQANETKTEFYSGE